MATLREFYRCPQCLVIVALEKRFSGHIACDNCKTADSAATLEFMGRVVKDRLVQDQDRCPCDERCTGARGPNCDCQCGGSNHGLGLVTVVVDVGGVPSVTQAVGAGKALGAWQEYQDRRGAVLQAVKDRYGDDFTRFVNRSWIANKDIWWEIRSALESIRNADGLRSQSGRIKRLEKILAQLQERKAA